MTALHIEHVFDIAPRDYAELYFDEPFSIELAQAVRLRRELLLLERTGSRVARHVRVEPVRDLPAPVAKLTQGRAFSYREEIEFDMEARRGRWRVVPSVLPEKVDASGALELLDAGAGVKRVVSGGVNIAVFGVGALVERFVVAEVVRSYEQAAEHTREILARRAR